MTMPVPSRKPNCLRFRHFSPEPLLHPSHVKLIVAAGLSETQAIPGLPSENCWRAVESIRGPLRSRSILGAPQLKLRRSGAKLSGNESSAASLPSFRNYCVSSSPITRTEIGTSMSPSFELIDNAFGISAPLCSSVARYTFTWHDPEPLCASPTPIA